MAREPEQIIHTLADRAPSDRELCSQPTISRLENRPDVRSLLRMGRAMVDLYCASFRQVPKRIVIPSADGAGGGRPGLRVLPTGAQADRARPRRHLRCRARRPAVALVQCPL